MKATRAIIIERCGYDEYLGMIVGNNREAIVKKYPLLYHLLFGKYKNIDENILKVLYYYLTNNRNLMKYAFPLYLSDDKRTYDEELSIEKKKEFITEILNSITLNG